MAGSAKNQGWIGRAFRRTPSSGLTAAGSPIVEPRRRPGPPVRGATPTAGSRLDPAAPAAIRARAQDWQKRILEYAESIPEVAGASALVRASLEGVKWKVTGTAAAGMRDRAQKRVDSLDTERVGELIWLSGESYVAVPVDPSVSVELTEREDLYSLSVLELNPHSDPASRKGPNDEQVDMLDPFMRIWRPSKGNRLQASSANKAAMDLLDAMYLSQLADTAVHRSRLAGAGIMFWPTNAPNIPIAEGEDPVAGSRQAMLQSFEDAAWSAIDKQTSREAVIPFVVMYDPTGSGGGSNTDYQPEMFRIERENHANEYATGVETRRRRYATAVELPVEAVEGMGGTNHWSAWQIDVDKWKTWFAPLCELIRKELEARVVKLYGPGLRLEVDASTLIKKPDQTEVIMKIANLEIATPDSIKDALISGDLSDLEMQDPPQRDYTSNSAVGGPSDFGRGDTDRGGGKFREQA